MNSTQRDALRNHALTDQPTDVGQEEVDKSNWDVWERRVYTDEITINETVYRFGMDGDLFHVDGLSGEKWRPCDSYAEYIAALVVYHDRRTRADEVRRLQAIIDELRRKYEPEGE